ncbi:MAG: hypothetical protein ACKO23_19420 [Gemmataceae bacterium]
MNPVRIRLYGLFPVTRQRYLTQLVAAGIFVVVLWGLYLLFSSAVRERLLDQRSEASLRFLAFWQAMPWIVAALAALQALEALIVLRRFRILQSASPHPVPTRIIPTTSPVSPSDGA